MESVIFYTIQFRNEQQANQVCLPSRKEHDAVTQHSLRYLAVGAQDLRIYLYSPSALEAKVSLRPNRVPLVFFHPRSDETERTTQRIL